MTDQAITWNEETPPFKLSERAEAAWKRWAADAIDAGTLHSGTLNGFCQFVEALADCERLRETIERDGVLLESGSGAVKSHPALNTLEAAKRTAMQWAKEYALTGASAHAMSKPRRGG